MFRSIALPLARPALAIGLSLALLETLNDIGATEYLGVRTLTVSVYNTWLNLGSLAGAAQIACVMLALVVALIGARAARPPQPRLRRLVAPSPAGGAGPAPSRRRALGCRGLRGPVALGFALPIGFLLRETLRRGLVDQLHPAFLAALATTVGLAALATGATLLLGVAVVTASRLAQRRVTQAMSFVVGFGYAVPGTVLALGLLAPLVGFDNRLNIGLAGARGRAREVLGIVGESGSGKSVTAARRHGPDAIGARVSRAR
jgi:iron(III) transport system permease protein